jgi:hypothetical protein
MKNAKGRQAIAAPVVIAVYRSAGVVAGGVAVEPVRPSANKSQRRVSSKNCSLTFGSF